MTNEQILKFETYGWSFEDFQEFQEDIVAYVKRNYNDIEASVYIKALSVDN